MAKNELKRDDVWDILNDPRFINEIPFWAKKQQKIGVSLKPRKVNEKQK